MKELLEKLNEMQEITKDYNKFKHLFSDDEGVRTLAKINEIAGQIKFYVNISVLKEIGHPEEKPIKETGATGEFVKIRPCAKELEGKTYLGIMIGDAALSSSINITDDKINCSWAFYNPAILIPELGKIVYGCESWWGMIKSKDDLKEITNQDIDNVWYVQALKNFKKG